MFYLAGQIFICLLLVMAIGFLMGWLLRSVGVSRQFVDVEGTWKMRLKQKDEMLSKMFAEMDEKEQEFTRLIESADDGTGDAMALKAKLQQANRGLADLEARLAEKERDVRKFSDAEHANESKQSEESEKIRSQLATLRGANSKKDNEITRLRATVKKLEHHTQGEQTKEKQTSGPKSEGSSPKPDSEHDELRNVFGIGPVLEKRLNAEGITTFRQVAEFSPDDIERIAAAIGCFTDRILRDNWLEGARQEHLRKYGEDL